MPTKLQHIIEFSYTSVFYGSFETMVIIVFRQANMVARNHEVSFAGRDMEPTLSSKVFFSNIAAAASRHSNDDDVREQQQAALESTTEDDDRRQPPSQLSFFSKTTKRIDWRNGDIDSLLFEALLLDILPNFPTLSRLDAGHNMIDSFRSIQERLSAENADTNSNEFRRSYRNKELRVLDLTGNPILESLLLAKKNSSSSSSMVAKEEIEAACRILQTFPSVVSFSPRVWIHRYHPKIQYEMILNHSGRRLVDSDNDSTSSLDLPLSVWPLVLERCTKPPWWTRSHSATGLYYLLRESPVMFMGRDETKKKKKNKLMFFRNVFS